MDVTQYQPGDIIDYNGEQVKVCSNGALMSVERGKFVAGPSQEHRISRENASELANLRWQKAREAFATGIIEGTGLPPTAIATDAWQRVASHAANVYMNTDSARGLADLGRFIAEHGGFAPGKADVIQDSNDKTESVARGIAQGAVQALLDALEKKRDNE